MFDQNNRITYNFLSTNKVILHNPFRKNTWNAQIEKIIIDGEEYFGDTVWGDDAIKVRDKRNSVIDIYYQ